MDLIELRRFEDPRMDTAMFRVRGPDLEAESTIDAYMIEDLFTEIQAVLAGTQASAGSLLGELELERRKTGEIQVSISGGPYISGVRGWSCGFAVSPHAVEAFMLALADEFKAAVVHAV